MTHLQTQLEKREKEFDEIAPKIDWRGYPSRDTIINHMSSSHKSLLLALVEDIRDWFGDDYDKPSYDWIVLKLDDLKSEIRGIVEKL
jgi:hypothetical protein